MFRSCLPSLLARLGGGNYNDDDSSNNNNTNGKKNIRSVLKIDPSTGALQIPSYIQISRADHCPLLKHAWGQNWDEVTRLCASQPQRTLHVTKYSGRTALHLATFDRRCPLGVARALLKANRQMIVVRDSNNYTPLHILAFFSAATNASTPVPSSIQQQQQQQQRGAIITGEAVATNHMGRTAEGVVGSTTTPDAKFCAGTIEKETAAKRADAEAELESRNVMSLFCDTAIMVEQELGRAEGKHREEEQPLSLLEGTSPLYLAAKKGAPLSILKILLETRSRTNWIAPSTGGEPYWYGNHGNGNSNSNINSNTSAHGNGAIKTFAKEKKIPGSSFSSPLEILLREDRLRSSMNASYYRNDAYLLGEEEDGNLLRRVTVRSNGIRSTRSRNTSASTPRMRSRDQRSPLHPDEILGVPHLIREMRRLAIDRCRDWYCDGNDDENREESQSQQRPENTATTTDGGAPVDDDTPVLFTQSQQRCLELWEKCVELLVTAGGGGIPLIGEGETFQPVPPGDHEESIVVPYGILHACVCCKVPVPSLVEIALILFPDQVYKRDVVHGMTPLHHILRAEHKYSYATSNLLTILLKGRATSNDKAAGVDLSFKTKNRIEKQQQQQLSIEAAAAGTGTVTETSSTEKMPELPSLSNSTALRNTSNVTVSSFHFPQALHLQSTALLPFPSEISNRKDNSNIHREHNGPIPLIFAIRLGLSMENVINKLLEANSHESLRTPDPISQLPPFALVATKVRISEKEQDQSSDQKSVLGSSQLPCSRPRASNPRSDDNRGQNKRTPITTQLHSNDVIAAVIGSTINALSSEDGSSEIPMTTPVSATFSSSLLLSSSMASRSCNDRNPKDNDSAPTYRLDDIYRLLLAHPQVLVQYVVEL